MPSTSTPRPPRRRALVAGVNTASDLAGPPLSFAECDAVALALA